MVKLDPNRMDNECRYVLLLGDFTTDLTKMFATSKLKADDWVFDYKNRRVEVWNNIKALPNYSKEPSFIDSCPHKDMYIENERIFKELIANIEAQEEFYFYEALREEIECTLDWSKANEWRKPNEPKPI